MGTGISIALAGNPNSGKTTLFNTLTGSSQYVGNWPGVTVEKKEGMIRGTGRSVKVVDLPGIYSLSPYTLEEIIARNYIIHEKPDVLINVVDATNLERNLYLTMQLRELGRPVVLALNMMDEVARKGEQIDCETLSGQLGMPVVPICARNRRQVHKLLETAIEAATDVTLKTSECLYITDPEILASVDKIGALVEENASQARLPGPWAALKLLEGDEPVRQALGMAGECKGTLEEAVKSQVALFTQAIAPRDRETVIAEDRYRQIEAMVKQVLRRKEARRPESWSDRIDRILTNRVLAIPIFFLLLFLVFIITFGKTGGFLSDITDQLINHTIRDGLAGGMEKAGFPAILQSLVLDGVVSGVGGILVFLPQIILLFFFLSLLEDTGYMARAAFIMDQLLRKIGLSGKAFIPLIMGFGCSVPAIMATRTIENERDRRLAILLTPFMSCSARFPIYALFAGTFFTASRGPVIFSIYALGILVAILSGLILKKTVLKGEPAPFVMEMPPYRFPLPRSVLRHIYDRGKDFLVRAGTVILAMSLLVWVLQTFTFSLSLATDNAGSIFGQLGIWLAPVFGPLGFGNWRAAVSLLTGFVAKEAVVSTMGILYGAGEAATGGMTLGMLLKEAFTPLSAYAFMAFCLLYMPCMAAFGTIRREMRSWKWTFFTVGWQTGTAYLVALLIYQGGRLLGAV